MAQHTALIEVHKELGAKMAPVNNWDLPLFYPGGTVAEHRHCRKSAGLIDLGDRVLCRIAGDLTALQKHLTVTIAGLATGTAAYGLWLDADGTIGADVTLCRMGDADCLASFGHGVTAAMVNRLTSHLPGTIQIQQLTGALSSFLLLGARADEVMNDAADGELPELWHWEKLTFCDAEDEFRTIVLKKELFGMPAWELIFNAEYAADLYEIFYRNTAVEPAGMTAFESLRIESLTPGLAEFTGHTPEQCLLNGTAPVKLIAAALPRHPAKPGAEITDESGKKLGTVTSGAFCPANETAKVLGFVEYSGEIAPGTVWNFGGNAGKIIQGK